MKPVAFELETPRSLDDALALMADTSHEVKPLAGGQSLVPLLNFRLARPDVLVDLNRLDELQYIRPIQGGLGIGAMTRQSVVERSDEMQRHAPLVSAVLPWVGHAAIRNRGTFGGSLAHADTAAELCMACLALDARIVVRSQRGERQIPITEFFVGPFTTALERDELLVEVRVPAWPPGAGWGFEEVARRRGDFAMVAVAAVLWVDSNNMIVDARLAYLSMGPTPLRAPAAEAALRNQPATRETFAGAATIALSDLEPSEDLHASREYRQHVAQALTRRALAGALQRAKSGLRP
jgi:carbon-monoxide dehydrogenase medium subunit/6-hydroxypseudooxynicotine dehydrogenase subunit alpha